VKIWEAGDEARHERLSIVVSGPSSRRLRRRNEPEPVAHGRDLRSEGKRSILRVAVMRLSVLVGSIVVSVAACGCGSRESATAPTPKPTGGATATINILPSNGLGNLGAQAFSPNPASVTQGYNVVWNNSDSTTHHIVLDDGSLDTGPIAPGRSSPAIVVPASGGTYHCTIHPTMVGTINVETVLPPEAPPNPEPAPSPEPLPSPCD
jgi:plastocyanin